MLSKELLAATAITKVGLRERRHHRRPGQIPIDLEVPRDFVPWRFSDARSPVPDLLRRAGRPRNLHNSSLYVRAENVLASFRGPKSLPEGVISGPDNK